MLVALEKITTFSSGPCPSNCQELSSVALYVSTMNLNFRSMQWMY